MDYPGKDAVSIDIGERISQMRKERKISQRALARLSEISANALNLIEQGKTTPTVSTLYKLADALEIPVTSFFKVTREEKRLVFLKGSERTRLPFSRGLWEGLGGEAFQGDVDPFVLTLEIGASSGPYPMAHSGHEFVICLRGLLEYEVEGEKFMLEPGDSLLFSAEMEHNWRNPGKVVTNVLFVLAGCEKHEHVSHIHTEPQTTEKTSD
jgi:transcriptional regulator with XRE-family HTH domain